MAVFSRSTNQNGQTTLISSGAYVTGKFNLNSILHVDGEIEGDINSNNTVIVGKKGIIKGSITADRVVINGQFYGNIKAGFIELLKGGVISGDIIAKNLSIEVGAKFNGQSTLIDQDSQIQIAKDKIDYIESSVEDKDAE